MRSKIVSRAQLNFIGKSLHLEDGIKCAFPKKQMPDAVFGDTIEAMIGAIYLDRGYTMCQKFIHDKIIMPYVDIETLEHKVTQLQRSYDRMGAKNKEDASF